MNEPTYPIYTLSARFTRDARPDETDRVVDGRVEDSIGWHNHMAREELSPDALAVLFEERWAAMLDKDTGWDGKPRPSLRTLNAVLIERTANLIRRETWSLEWFCHRTFDVGQTDEQALESFDRYVDRYRRFANYPPSMAAKLGDEYVCLMGAEDRWRWRGEKEGDPAPCRCSGCKASGSIRISH